MKRTTFLLSFALHGLPAAGEVVAQQLLADPMLLANRVDQRALCGLKTKLPQPFNKGLDQVARFAEPTKEQELGWKEWVASRPTNVRGVAERFEPWSLYRMKSTGQRVTVHSFGEGDDGKVTLTVNITGDFNVIMFDRQVFGINPDDLEPCELPAATEATGAVLTDDKDIEEHVNQIRPAILAARNRQ